MGLSERNFRKLCQLIHSESGIKMSDAKRLMLEGRLQKRMRELGYGSHDQYCTYLFSKEGWREELVPLIDRVTTNKTEFFREPRQFDYLQSEVLPELLGDRVRPKIHFWSAGCSSGEEPYTLAMVLEEFKGRYNGGSFTYEILATDLSTRVLEAARQAVYPHERVTPVPVQLRRKYLLRGKDGKKDMVRVVSELRKKILFQRLNFMENFNLRQLYEVIFCRNVTIYFDRDTRNRLMKKFLRQLAPDGFFFLGHSETLHDLDLPLVQVYSNVYRKPS